jgi:hypothetical protein
MFNGLNWSSAVVGAGNLGTAEMNEGEQRVLYTFYQIVRIMTPGALGVLHRSWFRKRP